MLWNLILMFLARLAMLAWIERSRWQRGKLISIELLAGFDHDVVKNQASSAPSGQGRTVNVTLGLVSVCLRRKFQRGSANDVTPVAAVILRATHDQFIS
jgi:hypothetical protein